MTVDHCTPVAFSYTAKGIVYLIAIIMTITIIFTLYKTVTYKHSDGTSRTGFSFWCAVPFQVFTILYLISHIINGSLYCPYHLYDKYGDVETMTRGILSVCLVIHYYLLLLILFLRIYYSFNGSMFAVSKCTVIIYSILYVVQPVLAVIGCFVYLLVDAQLGFIIVGIVFVIIIALIISLISLYVHKLIKIYKLSEGEQYYLSIITKTTILTIISLAVTTIAYLPFFAQQYLTGYTFWLLDLCSIMDVYTNYICVVVGFKMFTPYYLKLCGSFDVKCRICCGNILGVDVNTALMVKDLKLSTGNRSNVASTTNTMPSPKSTEQIEIR